MTDNTQTQTDPETQIKPVSGGTTIKLDVDNASVKAPPQPNPEYFSGNQGHLNKQPQQHNGELDNMKFDFSNVDWGEQGNSNNNGQQSQSNTSDDENGGSMVHDEDEKAIQDEQKKLAKLKKKNKKFLFKSMIGFVLLLAVGMVMNKYFPKNPKQPTEQVQVESEQGAEMGNPNGSDTAAIQDDIQAALGSSAGDAEKNKNDFVGVPASPDIQAASNAFTESEQPAVGTPAASEVVANPSIDASGNKQLEMLPNEKTAEAQAPEVQKTVSLKDEQGQPKWDFFFAETGLSDKEKQAEALKARLEEITGKKFALFPNDDAASETAPQAAKNNEYEGVDIQTHENAPMPIHSTNVVENTVKEHKPKRKNKQPIHANKPKKTHTRQMAKKSGNPKEIGQPDKAAKTANLGYSVKAVVFGKMWLNTANGTQAFVNGDTLPNGAVILDINPNNKIVKTNRGQFKID